MQSPHAMPISQITSPILMSVLPFNAQPLYNHRESNIFAYEALYAGPKRPKDWRGVDLSMLKFLAKFPIAMPIFVNLSNETIRTVDDKLIMDAHALNNIFFEWSETLVEEDSFKSIVKRLNSWGKNGARIVIDDFGAGRCGVQRIFAVEHVTAVKFDGDLFQLTGKNKLAMSLVESLVKLCETNQILTVAEGIESEQDFTAAKNLGVDFIQGFFIDSMCESEHIVYEGRARSIPA